MNNKDTRAYTSDCHSHAMIALKALSLAALVVFGILVSCRSPNNRKSWPLPCYDNYNTRFYPFAGRISKPFYKRIAAFGNFTPKSAASEPSMMDVGNILLVSEVHGKRRIVLQTQGTSVYTDQGDLIGNFHGVLAYSSTRSRGDFEPFVIIGDSLFQRLDSTVMPRYTHNILGSWFTYLIDINGDGKRELLDWDHEIIGTRFETRRVFILCLDPVTNKHHWEFPLASWPYLDAFLDLENDGKLEMLFGTYSPNNGVYLNGMTDEGEAYVILLDCYGNLLWRQTFYGSWLRTKSAVADMNLDRRLEIISFCDSWCDSCPGTRGVIAILNSVSGEFFHQYTQNSAFTSAAIANMNDDRYPEIVAASRDGKISIFDHNLKKLKEFQIPSDSSRAGGIHYDQVDCYVWALNDIDGDGLPEVIATTGFEEFLIRDPFGFASIFHEPKLLILDTDLSLLQEITLDSQATQGLVADLIPGGSNEIVLLTDKIEIYGAQ